MNTKLLISVLAFGIITTSCSTSKSVITSDNLSGEKMVIIGVVEYNYSKLENKRKIAGIDLFIDTEEKHSKFNLPENLLKKNDSVKQEYINTIGKYGDYEIWLKKGVSSSSESENLLTNLDMERSTATPNHIPVQKYTITDGKIINMGKLVIKYSGGAIENSRITYSYSLITLPSDTVAMFAFKQAYPDIYEKNKNEIYNFKSEFDKCFEYVLNHISAEKKVRLQGFVDEYPEEVPQLFKDLKPESQASIVEKIEEFTPEEFEEFLKIIIIE